MNHLKSVICLCTCLACASALLPGSGLADTLIPEASLTASAVSSGTCGKNARWELKSGVLRITGTGTIETANAETGNLWMSMNLDEEITRVEIAKGIVEIGPLAFGGLSNMTTVSIPDTVTKIGLGAFAATGLIDVTIPGSVKMIDMMCFCLCTELNHVTLGDGVETLASLAFALSSLTKLTYSNSLQQVGDAVFMNTPWIEQQNTEFLMIGKCLVGYKGSKTSLTIPSGTTSICGLSFSENNTVTSVTIPKGVTRIGALAFLDCKAITSISFPNTLEVIGTQAFSGTTWLKSHTEDFVIINNILHLYQGKETSITLPAGIKKVGDSAFEGSSVTAVRVPNGVTALGDFAFASCQKLEALLLPETLTEIGMTALCCPNLKNVILPRSVTHIDRNAFSELSLAAVMGKQETVPAVYRGSYAAKFMQENELRCTVMDTPTRGDLNGDGAINSSDAVLVLREYANKMMGGFYLADCQTVVSDINGDKRLNSVDAVRILKYYAASLVEDITPSDL